MQLTEPRHRLSRERRSGRATADGYGQVSQTWATDEEQPRPVSHSGRVQRTVAQLLPMLHRTSHAHEAPHVTVSQELLAVQLTLHAPGPHAMPRHELRPVHWKVHDAAAVQLTPLRHALSVLQRRSQFQPGGQVSCEPQLDPATEQSMMQTLLGPQLVQPGGHTLASGRPASFFDASMPPSPTPVVTHSPSLHVRPESQSAVVSHSNWPLR
jgi:hypothetical protein